MTTELNNSSPHPLRDLQNSNNDGDLISASTLIEQAYKQLYQRVQDVPDRDLAWKNTLLDKLDMVKKSSQ